MSRKRHPRIVVYATLPFAPTFVALRPVLRRRTARYASAAQASERLGMHQNSTWHTEPLAAVRKTTPDTISSVEFRTWWRGENFPDVVINSSSILFDEPTYSLVHLLLFNCILKNALKITNWKRFVLIRGRLPQSGEMPVWGLSKQPLVFPVELCRTFIPHRQSRDGSILILHKHQALGFI